MSARGLVAVSQRVDAWPERGERRDALDQRWAALLHGAGWVALLLPNHLPAARALLDAAAPAAVLLTGGNEVAPELAGFAPERHAVELALLDLARDRTLPLLGVCHGFQLVNAALGGKAVAGSGHVAATHGLQPVNGNDLQVNSFHHQVIPAGGLAAPLEPVAMAADGTVEAARHPRLPWQLVMWHPERPNPEGINQRALVDAALGGADAFAGLRP